MVHVKIISLLYTERIEQNMQRQKVAFFYQKFENFHESNCKNPYQFMYSFSAIFWFPILF